MTGVRYMAVAQLDLPRVHRVPRPPSDSLLLAAASADLQAAIAASPAPVSIRSPIEDVMLIATVSRNNLYASLLAAGMRFSTIGIPRRATVGPRLWGEMTTHVPTQTDRPAWPWVAMMTDYARLRPSREAAAWLISYAAALGWSYIT